MWQVEILRKARKNLHKLPAKAQQRIAVMLVTLAKDPFIGKKLKGELAHQYGVRVWPYRVVYEIKRKKLIVLVINIDHRQGVYK